MFNGVKNYFKNQIKEIESSQALMNFGVFLSFIHLLVYYTFNSFTFYNLTMIDHPSRICWSFFSDCSFLKFPSALSIKITIFIYLGLIFTSIYLFLTKKIKYGYFTLLFLSLFMYLIILFDFKSMGNFYYMPLILMFLFLLFPSKKISIPIMSVLFYVFAGILKLHNLDWLAGGQLHSMENWNPYFILFLTHSTVIFQIFVSPLALLRHWIKYIVFAYFILFHIVSYYWIHWFYAVICCLWLSIFPLIWFADKSHENLIEKLFTKSFKKAALIPIVLFIIAQIAPRLYYRGDTAVTGEGRTWSLNMYDAQVSCYSYVNMLYKDRKESLQRRSYWLSSRIGCDPYLYYLDAKKLCAWGKKNPDFIDINLYLEAKRASDLKYTKVIHLIDFCSKDIKYNFIRGNDWINF